VKKPLLLLVCAVACMLLIGCLNVANRLVARGAARQKEVAIRGALGARRLTLIREQLMESVVICVAGGTIGMLVSMAATQWVGRMWKDLPSASTIHVDTAVLTFACTLVFVTALLAGLLPAIAGIGTHCRGQPVADSAAERAADGGDCRNGHAADCRRAVVEELLATPLD
jgi:ABC-type lipoprotein release transport system permease subunit